MGLSGLNIEGCRIGIEKEDKNLRFNSHNHIHKGSTGFLKGDKYEGVAAKATQDIGYHSSSGRYPANLLLSHHPECVCEGEERIEGDKRGSTGGHIRRSANGNVFNSPFKSQIGLKGAAYGDSEGKETIDKWTCHPDCIVGQMNIRAGVKTSHGGGSASFGGSFGNGKKIIDTDAMQRFKGDAGYVSRYFKQFAFDPERLLYSGKASKKERGIFEKYQLNENVSQEIIENIKKVLALQV